MIIRLYTDGVCLFSEVYPYLLAGKAILKCVLTDYWAVNIAL